MLHNVLQENVEKEDLQLCGDFGGRTGVYLHKDSDVFFEGDELGFEFVVICGEVVHLVELFACSLDEAFHEDVEGVLAMQLLTQFC